MRRPPLAPALSLAAGLALGGAVAWLLLGREGAETRANVARGAEHGAPCADASTDSGGSPDRDAPRDDGATAQRSLTSGRGALAGRVLARDDDAPIAGALVELHPAEDAHGAALATATTGPDGAYRFDDVESRSEAILIVRADGFASALVRESDDPVRAGVTSTLATIHLSPGAVLHGRAVDVEGRPLAGVKVGSIWLDDPPVESDGDGRFTLRRVPMRPVDVAAAKPGYLMVPSERIEVSPRTRDANGELVLRLAPAVALRGHVRTRDGRPFPDAAVYAVIARPLALRCTAAAATCDSEGRFGFAALPAGAIANVSAGSDWIPEQPETEVTVGSGEVELVVDPWPLLALDFVDAASGARLVPNHLIVRVVDPRTGPLPESGSDSHDPWLDFEWTARAPSCTPPTAADGRVVVPFGHAIAILESKIRNEASERPSEWQCEVTASAAGHADATVSFRVADAAAPPGVPIAFEPAGAVVGRGVDADGALEGRVLRGGVDVVAGATARLDSDLGAPSGQGIRGVVHGPRARRGSLYACASAVEVATRDPRFESGGRRRTLDAEGAFELPDLEAGRWSVEVHFWPHDLVAARAEVVVEAGRWTPVEFEVGTRTMSGRLFDRASGAPLALDCWLRANRDAASAGPLFQERAGADGRFTYEGLVPDAYELRVGGDHSPIATFPVDLRDGDALDLEVALDAASKFTVDPKRLADAGFTLRSLALERASSLTPLAPRDDDGSLVFDGLPPDTYALVADGTTRDGVQRTLRCDVNYVIGRPADLTDRIVSALQQ